MSLYFTNRGKMMPPLENLGLDLNQDMIEELNAAAKKLKLSRQALIKRFIRHGLDEHQLSQKVRKAG
ncbi:MAG TPA: ribbon-helix-helix protein, CopG family [Pyrinomonadaceae bacterium]